LALLSRYSALLRDERRRGADGAEPEPPTTCPHGTSPYWDTPRKHTRPARKGWSLGW